MKQRIGAALVILIGSVLILLAYRMSARQGNELRATSERLNQQYRCIIAQGRPLRGADPAACRAVGY